MITALIWLATILISYFIFRSSVKRMDKDAKETMPVGQIMFFMLVPLTNLVFSTVIWIVFCTDVQNWDKCDFVDKIFFIKKKVGDRNE